MESVKIVLKNIIPIMIFMKNSKTTDLSKIER